MTRTQFSAIAIAFSTLLAGQAMADNNGPETRAQVKAELAEAVRTGTMPFSVNGQLVYEAAPNNASSQQNVASKSREQVKAELAEAVRTGNIVAVGQSNAKLNELFPQSYPTQQAASTVTRDQVRAELAEAVRTGTMPFSVSGQLVYDAASGNGPTQQNLASYGQEQSRATPAEVAAKGTSDRTL